MTAVLKSIPPEPNKGKVFRPPSESEVREYITEKKGWPQPFVNYYAERFWNFYQSNGWKVSGKAPMKDFKAAFNSQWQHLKFKEDIDFFNKCKMTEKAPAVREGASDFEQTIAYLDELLIEYRNKYDSIPAERLSSCYDWLKIQGMIKLDREEIKAIKDAYGSDPEKGKAACVSTMFKKMINVGKTFRGLVKTK